MFNAAANSATFPFKPLPFKGLRTVRPRLCLKLDDRYRSSHPRGVPSINLLHKLRFHLDSLQPVSMHGANRTLVSKNDFIALASATTSKQLANKCIS